MAEIKREAAERHAAKEVAKAILRAKRKPKLAARRRKYPWLNPKLTDTQAYRLQYKLDADFRAREVARSVRRRQETPLLRTYENMIARCENPNVKAYHRYGGRGIRDRAKALPPSERALVLEFFSGSALGHLWNENLNTLSLLGFLVFGHSYLSADCAYLVRTTRTPVRTRSAFFKGINSRSRSPMIYQLRHSRARRRHALQFVSLRAS